MPTQPDSFGEMAFPVVLLHALKRAGVEQPFPIQHAVIPDALVGRDILGRAPTGSGKTLAFGLPMLVRLSGAASARAHPRGLILAPTRELAIQIESALDDPARAVGVRVVSVVGGMPIKRQAERILRGVDVLVATPGRLADLVDQDAVSLDQVSITVVDEADRMADFGFLPVVTTLLNLTPDSGQRMLFSATLDKDVDSLVQRFLHDAARHTVGPDAPSSGTMDHVLLHLGPADRDAVVARISARTGKTMLFARTKFAVDRWVKRLRAQGISAAALHGGMAQHSRNRTLAEFTNGSVPVLVATDVASRGLHVDGVSLVVHLDPPAEFKDYLHRAGRTARAGDRGAVITLVTPDQDKDVRRLIRLAGVTARVIDLPGGNDEFVRVTGARAPSGLALDDPTAPPVAPPKSTRQPHYSRRGAGGFAGGDKPKKARGQRRGGR